jgi:arylsulfatase A-like enzyme
MDAARGDRISALSYARPTTPNLDALLVDGIAWTDAVVQCPASGPSHATMLTGLPPLAHQVLFNADILHPDVLTVAERLRNAGFATAAFADNFYIDARYGFDQGFDTFVNEFRASAVRSWSAHHLLRTTVVYHVWYRLSRTPGQKNTDSLDGAIQWLRHRPAGDWFLFLHLMDPHAPYDAPPEIRDRFYEPEGEPVRDTVELRSRLDAASDAEIEALEDLYDASIALADHKLGMLIEEMTGLGLLENSLIVVTADHGEVLAENGPVFDHGLPDQGNLHVPLVMAGGRAPGEGGQRVDSVVSTTSWVATAFAALGLEYAEQGAQAPSGPLPLGEDDAVPVYGMTGITDLDRSYALADRMKLLLGPEGIAGCFDLSEDPLERTDLCADGVAPILMQLEEGLLNWLEETAAAGIVAGRRSDQAFDAATREQLKALGYIE